MTVHRDRIISEVSETDSVETLAKIGAFRAGMALTRSRRVGDRPRKGGAPARHASGGSGAAPSSPRSMG
jgi:hypothetical protein